MKHNVKTEEDFIMQIGQAIGCRIQELCKERGITVHRLATLAKVPASTVYDLVNGKTSDPWLTTILPLCGPLHVTPGEFFYGVDAFLRL